MTDDSGSENKSVQSTSSLSQNLEDFKSEVKKQARQQIASWALGLIVFLVVVAGTGWLLYLKPMIDSYIKEAAGGVPVDVIVASTSSCDKLPGRWQAFKEGTGRFLIGAGDDFQPSYATWTPVEGGKPIPLSTFTVLTPGGEAAHRLSELEMPKHTHDGKKKMLTVPGLGPNAVLYDSSYPDDATTAVKEAVGYSGENSPHNNMPPFVALYFCKKV